MAGTGIGVLKNYLSVWVCGDNFYGQLGDGTNGTISPPLQINTCSVFLSIVDSFLTPKLEIYMYPNPSDGKFTLLIMDDEFRMMNYEIKIYNVLGELVFESLINNASIDLSNHPKGIYTVVISSKEKTVYKKLFIQ